MLPSERATSLVAADGPLSGPARGEKKREVRRMVALDFPPEA
jgi:hypothetical protein